jgi:hypothetical protein
MSDSKYKSFIKPVKFWQKSQKESNIDDLIKKDYQAQHGISEEETPRPQLTTKSTSYMPSFGFSKKTKDSVVALTESGKTEVYKLSTIDNSGLYMPPSPTLEGKRDHWIEVAEEDMMDFHLPSSDCLTTFYGEQHHFFTPSTFVNTQPYILPTAGLSDSTLSAVPSLDDTNSELSSL